MSMHKTVSVIVALMLAACTADDATAPDGGAIDPATSHVFGEWTLEFDGTACGKPEQSVIGIRIELVNGDAAVTRWALHEQYEDAVVIVDGGAEIELVASYGPDERVLLSLRDDGAKASATLSYETIVVTEPCALGPVDAGVTSRVRQDAIDRR